MLGLAPDRPGAVPHGLPVRAHPRPGRPEDVEDEGQRRRPARRHRRDRRRRAALRAHPRRDAGQRPAVRRGQARERPQLRQQALERDALRRRRATGARSPTAPSDACPTRATSARPSAGSCRARRRRPRPSTRRWPTTRSARSPGSLYDAIWSEFCDWGLELAKVRLADERARAGRPRGDVVDAGRGARHVPAAAPSGHAVRHRGAVGGPARIAPATRTCSSSPAGPGWGSATSPPRREVGRSSTSSRRSATPARRPGCRPRDWLTTGSSVPARSARRSRPCDRPSSAWPGPARSSAPDPRGARGGRRPPAISAVIAGRRLEARDPRRRRRDAGAADARTRAASNASSTRPRAGSRPPASGSPTRRSSPRRRRRSSRVPAPARPSWPTRSTGCGTDSGAERAGGGGATRPSTPVVGSALDGAAGDAADEVPLEATGTR